MLLIFRSLFIFPHPNNFDFFSNLLNKIQILFKLLGVDFWLLLSKKFRSLKTVKLLLCLGSVLR